jgi:hypothetical protein
MEFDGLMGRNLSKQDRDGYLHIRDGNCRYRRKVSSAVGKLDFRFLHVQISVRADDLAIARAKPDAGEVEIKDRATGERETLSIEAAINKLAGPADIQAGTL